MRLCFALLATLVFLLPYGARADARIAGAKQCTAYIANFERAYGIPSHLLSAISSTETGRYHDRLKIALPWPWTINVEGKGYYFHSKAEAIAAVKQHQAAGRRSIDIGCMQVNLIHHPNAFANLDQAFDPKYNVRYAASFLRRLYEEEKSWRKAAAAYHSKTPSRGSQYVARVFRAWETIVTRLRLSKQETMRLADAGFDGKNLVENATPSKAVNLTRASDPVPAAPVHEPVRLKVIKVDDAAQMAKNDVVLIKPDVKPSSVAKVQNARPTITRVDTKAASYENSGNLNIIRMDRTAGTEEVEIASVEPAKVQPSGPRFIFTE